MTRGGDFNIGGITAIFAIFVSIPTFFRAGCILGIVLGNIMSLCRYRFLLYCAAYGTGIGFQSCCRTCSGECIFDFNPRVSDFFSITLAARACFPMISSVCLPCVAIIVPVSGNFDISGVTAIRALFVSIPTEFLAGCRLGFMLSNSLMPRCRDWFRFRGMAIVTGIESYAVCRAGRLYGYFTAVPFMFNFCGSVATTRALFPMVISIFFPCIAVVVRAKSAIWYAAGIARGLVFAGSYATEMGRFRPLCLADRAFAPMVGRVGMPICPPGVVARYEYSGASACNCGDFGVAVFVLEVVGSSIALIARSNLNISRITWFHFCCHADGCSVCQCARNFNNLTTGQINVVCGAVLFVFSDVDISGDIELITFAVIIHTAAVAGCSIACNITAVNGEVRALTNVNAAALTSSDIVYDVTATDDEGGLTLVPIRGVFSAFCINAATGFCCGVFGNSYRPGNC